jgi:hypothetical protein
MTGNGNGTFTGAPIVPTGTSPGLNAIAAADLNVDGYDDLIWGTTLRSLVLPLRLLPLPLRSFVLPLRSGLIRLPGGATPAAFAV